MTGNDITRKILIDLEVKNQDSDKAVKTLAKAVSGLTTALKNYQGIVAMAKDGEGSYSKELQQSILQQQKAKTAIDQLKLAKAQEAEATKKAKAAMVAAAGSYDAAQKQLTALGRAIKSAKDGFDSTSPAIQKQIKEYNDLNDKLKAFDARMGNHQRKVGEYERSLNNLSSILESIVPGFGRASNAIQQASQVIGFMGGITGKAKSSINNMVQAATQGNSMFAKFAGFKQFNTTGTETVKTFENVGQAAEKIAPAAEGAEGAIGGLAAETVAMTGPIAAVVLLLGAMSSWFLKLTPQADKLKQQWEGLKSAWDAFNSDGGPFTMNFSQSAADMTLAYEEGKRIAAKSQDLRRAQLQDIVDDAEAERQIADLQIKMKNAYNKQNIDEERRLADQIKKIEENKYVGNLDLAKKEYELAIQKAVNGRNFTADEIKRLRAEGLAYAAELDKKKGLIGGDEALQRIAAAQQKIVSTKAERTAIEERAQNRLDQVQLHAEEKARQAQEKADKLKDKMEHDLSEAKQGLLEAQSLRAESIAKMQQSRMEDLAKELSTLDEGYRQKIFKEREFITKMEGLQKSTKSPEARARFGQAISAGKDAMVQFEKERQEERLRVITDFNKKTRDEVVKNANELAALQSGLNDNAEQRETAQVAQQQKTQIDAIEAQQTQVRTIIARLNNEIVDAEKKKDKGVTEALKSQLNLQEDLLADNAGKQLAIIKDSQQKIAEIRKKYADEHLKSNDSTNVSRQTRLHGADSNEVLAAKQQELLDLYNIEVSQKALTEQQKLDIEQAYLEKSAQLQREALGERMAHTLQYEELIQSTALSIASNAINSSLDYKLAALNREKDSALRNANLTGSQKQILEQKFQNQENALKVKAFKQDQKLRIAEALMNLAVGELKLWASPGFPAAIPMSIFLAAQGAVQIASIAAQKPPAYATGRGPLDYQSNGKGTVLRGRGTGTSDSMLARVSTKEAIINAKSTQMFRGLLSAINVAGGGVPFDQTPAANNWLTPGFATGGIPSYTPNFENGASLTPSMASSLNVRDLAGAIVEGNAKLPIPEVVVNVRDINHQQAILANTVNRVSL